MKSKIERAEQDVKNAESLITLYNDSMRALEGTPAGALEQVPYSLLRGNQRAFLDTVVENEAVVVISDVTFEPLGVFCLIGKFNEK